MGGRGRFGFDSHSPFVVKKDACPKNIKSVFIFFTEIRVVSRAHFFLLRPRVGFFSFGEWFISAMRPKRIRPVPPGEHPMGEDHSSDYSSSEDEGSEASSSEEEPVPDLDGSRRGSSERSRARSGSRSGSDGACASGLPQPT